MLKFLGIPFFAYPLTTAFISTTLISILTTYQSPQSAHVP